MYQLVNILNIRISGDFLFYFVYTNVLIIILLSINLLCKSKIYLMKIVTSCEFRACQKKYFETAPIMVCAVRDDDFPSREELSVIQKGIKM